MNISKHKAQIEVNAISSLPPSNRPSLSTFRCWNMRHGIGLGHFSAFDTLTLHIENAFLLQTGQTVHR